MPRPSSKPSHAAASTTAAIRLVPERRSSTPKVGTSSSTAVPCWAGDAAGERRCAARRARHGRRGDPGHRRRSPCPRAASASRAAARGRDRSRSAAPSEEIAAAWRRDAAHRCQSSASGTHERQACHLREPLAMHDRDRSDRQGERRRMAAAPAAIAGGGRCRASTQRSQSSAASRIPGAGSPHGSRVSTEHRGTPGVVGPQAQHQADPQQGEG